MTIDIPHKIDDKVFFINDKKIVQGEVKDFILYGSKKGIVLKFIISVYENKHTDKIEVDSEFVFKTKAELKKSL